MSKNLGNFLDRWISFYLKSVKPEVLSFFINLQITFELTLIFSAIQDPTGQESIIKKA